VMIYHYHRRSLARSRRIEELTFRPLRALRDIYRRGVASGRRFRAGIDESTCTCRSALCLLQRANPRDQLLAASSTRDGQPRTRLVAPARIVIRHNNHLLYVTSIHHETCRPTWL